MIPRIQTKPTVLDETIDAALAELKDIKTTDPAYQTTMNSVKELYKLKEQTTPKRVSPDTMAMIFGNLAGIVLILNYEQAHVVTSKALSFVLKSK
jgi:membrane-associated HD superfamily phosphohydrolase